MAPAAGLAAVILRLVFALQKASFRRFSLYSLRLLGAIFCKKLCQIGSFPGPRIRTWGTRQYNQYDLFQTECLL